MKRFLLILSVFLIIGLLTACGNKVDNIQQTDDEKAKAKVSENTSDDTEKKETEDQNKEDDSKKEEDIWTYYENANWEGTWEGLKYTIQKTVVSDKAPQMKDGNEVIGSAVGVKMQIENTTADKVYTTYPDQATLVTSTGEQVDADMWISDHLGGEIHEGVIKEGNIIFYLERGNAEAIEWIKLKWSNSYSDPGGDYSKDLYDDQEVKIQLK